MDYNKIILFFLVLSLSLNIYLIFISKRCKQMSPIVPKPQESVRESQKAFINYIIKTNEKIYHFANFLHSELGGTLSSIKLQLSHIQYIEEEKSNPNPKLTETVSHLSELIRIISRYSSRLIPGSLLQVGLESAIRSFIKKADLDHSTKLTYQGEGEFPSFSKDQSIGWFLIISEYINTLINQSLCRSITLVTKKETSSFILTINSVLEEVYTEDFHSKIDLNILSAQAEAVHAHIDFNTTNRANPILSILYKPQSMH